MLDPVPLDGLIVSHGASEVTDHVPDPCVKVSTNFCVPVSRAPLFVPPNHSAVRLTATRVFGPGTAGSLGGGGPPGPSVTVKVTAMDSVIVRSGLLALTLICPVYVPAASDAAEAMMRIEFGDVSEIDPPDGVAASHGTVAVACHAVTTTLGLVMSMGVAEIVELPRLAVSDSVNREMRMRGEIVK